MARYRQGAVGKPSMKRVLGEGDSYVVQMGDAGQVFKCSSSVPRDGISRDPGQDLPHMRSNLDPVTSALNRGAGAAHSKVARPDDWKPVPLSLRGGQN